MRSEAHKPESYRGRIAPSPTGLLHLGHARTFWIAYQRAMGAGGTLILRNDDLDPQRSRPEFVHAMMEDLGWVGICWQQGPFSQSRRTTQYLAAWEALLTAGHVYPCHCSRRELAAMAGAPHEGEADAEPIYPGTCRRKLGLEEVADWLRNGPNGANWRFRVPTGQAVTFVDNNPAFGDCRYVAGVDFGDFAVWRRDGVPAYQLASTIDDIDMQITEVVRGADLLVSTGRQILLQRALAAPTPQHYHCELVKDDRGQRLAKRHDALSLRSLREQGWTAERVITCF